MNLTHTKYRNRLIVDKVDRLCYIHINRKILDCQKTLWKEIKNQFHELTDEEAVELETMMLEAENAAYC